MAADIIKNDDHDDVKTPFVTKSVKVEMYQGQSDSLAAANAQYQKAEKMSRPSITCWKPQHRKAGDDFCQAALMFCQAGESKRGKDMLLKASECYKKKRIWYSAAKAIDQAIALALEEGDSKTMEDLAWRTAALYRKAGHPDSAAQVLERVGKELEDQLPSSCIEMLEKAAETVETENRPIQAASYVNKLLRIALTNNDMENAVKKSKKLVQLYQEAGHKSGIEKSFLGLIVILVSLDNLDDAELAASEFGNYSNCEQGEMIENLINGFDNQDEERIIKGLNSSCLEILDPEFEPILENLKIATSAFHKEIPQVTSLTEVKLPFVPKKLAPIYDGSDLELADEEEINKETEKPNENKPKLEATESDETVKIESSPETLSVKSSVEPTPSHKPLQKTVTINLPESKRESKVKPKLLQKRATMGAIVMPRSPSAKVEFGGMAESVKDYKATSISGPGVFVDVMGIEPLQPGYMGMTTDQWREFKRSQTTCDDYELEEFDYS